MPAKLSAKTATVVLVFLFAAACSRKSESEPTGASARRDLNVLLITIDTLRADHLSCYNPKTPPTPNMDQLASRGMRFDQAVVQVPLTAPSHASILTGTYPQIHKLRDMGGFVLDGTLPTLATILRDAGFDSAAFVGAAVLHHYYGLGRGFNRYVDDMTAGADSEKLPGIVAEIRGEVVTRRALEWLDGHVSQDGAPSRNFFLWVHYYDPHFPYDPPEPYRSRYAGNRYAGEVVYTDSQVGALIEALSKHGLQDRTLIVLLSDHGESLGEHGEYTHGVFLYDSTMRIPLIVAGPGIPSGRVVEQQVRSIDLLPTILEFIGLTVPQQVQGVSLVPAMLEGRVVRSQYSYMETLYPKTSHGWSELRGIRTDTWKLIVAPKPELYWLSTDPLEKNNVVQRFPADADRLQKQVWEVAGPPSSLGELKTEPVNAERRRELEALGYVGAGNRTIHIDMSGPDPKDRVAVLEILERVADHVNHDRFRAAVPMLEKAVREDPTNPVLYNYLGLCFRRLGQFERAEQVYRLAIQNEAQNDETYAKLGEIYLRRDDLPRAVEALERAAHLSPTNLDNMVNLATAYLHLGRRDDTERALKAVLLQSRQHAAAQNLFGILEIQRGRAREAQQYFEKARQSNPELADPYLNLGLLAQESGQTKAAIDNYRLFLEKAKADKYADVIPKVNGALAQLEGRR